MDIMDIIMDIMNIKRQALVSQPNESGCLCVRERINVSLALHYSTRRRNNSVPYPWIKSSWDAICNDGQPARFSQFFSRRDGHLGKYHGKMAVIRNMLYPLLLGVDSEKWSNDQRSRRRSESDYAKWIQSVSKDNFLSPSIPAWRVVRRRPKKTQLTLGLAWAIVSI